MAEGAGPSNLDVDELEDEDLDDTMQPLNIESGPQATSSRGGGGGGRLQRLLCCGGGASKSSGRQRSRRRGGAGGIEGLVSRCAACFGRAAVGASEEDAEAEALLFALTWSQPQRYGIAPSPRNGHTMILIGMQLYVFGGSDENVSYNDTHTLHVGTMTWEKPIVHGTPPGPRSRHSATAVGHNMVVFGGVGGGNDLHILETDTLTWYVPKVGGEPPLPRFGHSSTLVESATDQVQSCLLPSH